MEIPVVLEVQNLTKRYGDRLAVSGVSFEIAEGEIFGLIGANGAGKTTILKCICGLVKPDEGGCGIYGQNIQSNFKKAISEIGAVIESPALYPYMSGMDNLKYFASLYKDISISQINKIVELVGLTDRIKDKVHKYSLGMKQRLAIALALLNSPKLLILDEPTNGLDPNGIKEVREFLINFAKMHRVAVLICSHILPEMEQMCDRIGIINNGKLLNITKVEKTVEVGKLDVKNKVRFLVTVNAPNFAAKIINQYFKTVKFEISGSNLVLNTSTAQMQEVYKAFLDNNVNILNVSTTTKTLEDLYNDVIDKHNKKQNNRNQNQGGEGY